MLSRPSGIPWPRRTRCLRYRRSDWRTAATGFPRLYDGLWANTTFEDLGVHPALVQALATQDIVRPTVVQAEAFQPLVKGRDAMLCAETGSGKTLAYLLPLVNRIYHLHDRAREIAKLDGDAPNPLHRIRPWVVLAPTSDLCAQILAMLEKVDGDRIVAAQSLQRLFKWEALGVREPTTFQAPHLKERTTLREAGDTGGSHLEMNGQAPYSMASPRIKWGATDVIVSTPIKFCEDLERFKADGIFPACIVMDEADALFHGPSRTYLYDIFAAMRPRLKIRRPDEARERLPDLIPSQFVFSAATMVHIGPFSAGNMIIERFCTADVVQTPRFHQLPSGISRENLRWLEGSDDWDRRVEQLVDVLRRVPCERTLVFVNTVKNCHVLLNFLRSKGWPVVSFMKGPMGRMGPRFRDAQKFADGECSILVATDFGGRGIDWPEVDHVVNFQMPTNGIFWLHRVGRTGRIGRRGFVTNFVGGKDQSLASMLKERLESNREVHGAFSRKRSLRKRLRATHSQDDDDTLQSCRSDEGTYRLEGGLELYAEGLERGVAQDPVAATEEGSAASSHDGTIIGYLSVEDAATATERKRPGKERAKAISRDSMWNAASDDDAVDDFRRQLLESDSEEDSEMSGDEGADDEEDHQSVVQRGSIWSKLGDEGDGAVIAAPPRRQLINRSIHLDEHERLANSYSRGTERYDWMQKRPRKGRGVAAASQARSGRNYSEPDDDLLPI